MAVLSRKFSITVGNYFKTRQPHMKSLHNHLYKTPAEIKDLTVSCTYNTLLS
jgi:hypothetical protein